jgi:1,4-dihydroxy-2-naphthoate octaprenyltransferase
MVPFTLSGLFRLIRPAFLVGGVVMYSLGVGIAHYLGRPIDWETFIFGLLCVILLQLLSIFLGEYFDALARVESGRSKIRIDLESSKSLPYRLSVNLALVLSASVLTFGAVFTMLIYRKHDLSLEGLVILGVAFLLAFFYAAPPLHLADSGFGDLVMAILVANLIPALGYLFQAGQLHRLMAMATFPLTPLYLAMSLALGLPNYGRDSSRDKRTLLVMVGWQRGMGLHNLLILIAFLILGIAVVLGLPFQIVWSAFLGLPVGLFQIWQINRIMEGVKPRWRLLEITALASFGLVAYLLAFSFWSG